MRNVTLTRTATLTLLAAMTLLAGCATVTAPPPPVVIDLCNTTVCTTWHPMPWPPRHHEHEAERER